MAIPERGVWENMRQRCNNPKRKDFPRYGGKGIRVCDEWQSSFQSFYRDMGPRPSSEYQIDRRDSDGDYEPDNCRWVTALENNLNRKSNRFLEHNGRRMTIAEWERFLGAREGTIYMRLKRGWSVAKSLTEDVRQNPVYTYQGRAMSLTEWSKETGISMTGLKKRLRKWPIEKALTEPLKK